MNNATKGLLAAIPLVVGLSGPATASLSESTDAGTTNGSPLVIDSLLNYFSGLTPGDHDTAESENRTKFHGRHISAFTSAVAPMSSYYTGQGSDKIVSGSGSSVNEPFSSGREGSGDTEAAPPSSGLSSVIHAEPESLGAIAAEISSSTSDASPANKSAGAQPNNDGNGTFTTTIVPGNNGNVTYTTTIIPADPAPVPLPAAVVLLGSGLAALAPLRKKKQ